MGLILWGSIGTVRYLLRKFGERYYVLSNRVDT
jgi:hypothetical protein